MLQPVGLKEVEQSHLWLCLSGFSDQVLVWLLRPLFPGDLNSDLCLLGT